MDMEFGEILHRYRVKKGLKQGELAARMGVSRNTITNWETGHCWPDIPSARQLCVLLDLPVNELFGLPDEAGVFPEELALLKEYRRLGETSRRSVELMIKALRQAEDEAEERSLRENFRVLDAYDTPAAAGKGSPFGDEPPRPFFVRVTPENKTADAVVRVSGRSMEPVYHDGDWLYVKYTSSAEDGEDVICSTADGAVVKRVRGNTLFSVNSDYPFGEKSEDDHVRILGRVVGIVGEDDVPTDKETGRLEEVLRDELRGFGEG